MITALRSLAAIALCLICFTAGAEEGEAVAHPQAEALAGLGVGVQVAVMRHGQAGVGESGGESDLTAAGIAQVQRLGAALRALEIQPSRIITSPLLRCRSTAAQLGLGAVEVEPALTSMGASGEEHMATVRALIAAHRAEGQGLLLLVTHQPNVAALSGLTVSPADLVILDPATEAGQTLIRTPPREP